MRSSEGAAAAAPMTTKQNVDLSRCFPVSSLQHQQPQNDLSREALIKKAKDLMGRCCQNSSRKGSLYTGGLGPHVYLRYQVSKLLLLENTCGSSTKRNDERLDLLHEAKMAGEYAFAQSSSSSSFRVSLLEGKQIGSLCLLAAIENQLGLSTTKSKYSPSYILSKLDSATANLPPNECEVLYGRAGAIQAMLWLRHEFEDPTIGHDLIVRLAVEILQEGQKNSKRDGLPLSWEWHEKVYLGAAHGIVGILQTLLSLHEKDWAVIHQQYKPTALEQIQATIHALLNPNFCFESGNLESSIKKQQGVDRLVHWCHGAPGLVLLLIQAGKVFPNDKKMYIEYAQRIANNVIWPRGLLRKGVGLCHGISGNGMILFRLSMVLDDAQEMQLWRTRAFQYMNFALNNLNELESIPDRPYSMYEGLGGLVCFLLQYATILYSDGAGDGGFRSNGKENLARFPLYEY